MRKTILLVVSALNASTIPAVADGCTSNKDIDASRLATLRSQPANAADHAKTCCAYAASFYESVTLCRLQVDRPQVVSDSA